MVAVHPRRLTRRIGLALVIATVATVATTATTSARGPITTKVLSQPWVLKPAKGYNRAVFCIQRALNLVSSRGLAEDGKYGWHTQNAVADFQKYFNLGGARYTPSAANGWYNWNVGTLINKILHDRWDVSWQTWKAECFWITPGESWERGFPQQGV